MDSATGTFTSMDTYGGSLSDPMSLHKYLFANSNPVKWCDPSGHMTLVDELGTCAINGMLSNAYVFWFDLCVNIDNANDITDNDYLAELIKGAISGFIGGLLGMMLTGAGLATPLGCAILIFIVLSAVFGCVLKAITEGLDEIGSEDDYGIKAVSFMTDVLGDVLLTPIKNLVTLGSDLLGLILDLAEWVMMDYVFK